MTDTSTGRWQHEWDFIHYWPRAVTMGRWDISIEAAENRKGWSLIDTSIGWEWDNDYQAHLTRILDGTTIEPAGWQQLPYLVAAHKARRVSSC